MGLCCEVGSLLRITVQNKIQQKQPDDSAFKGDIKKKLVYLFFAKAPHRESYSVNSKLEQTKSELDCRCTKLEKKLTPFKGENLMGNSKKLRVINEASVIADYTFYVPIHTGKDKSILLIRPIQPPPVSVKTCQLM